VTRILLYLIKIFVLFAALLGLNVEEMCSIPQETPAPAEAPAPLETPSPAPREGAEPALRTPPGVCPEGQCVVGRTNTMPPQVRCGECPASTPRATSSFCPKPLALGAYVYLNDKPYGQGFDSTPRVHGDPEFCRLIHGVAINDCHLEGWPRRAQCEMELMHGCPIWQFTVDGGTTAQPCVDNHAARASCDHFGSVEYRDDPQTPTTGDSIWTLKGFEGRPLECGLQRNAYGPMAGFFTVAHGVGYVRACQPNGAGCGPWRPFDH
jgi:hypothetical protein